jgi:nucleotide-binding universal stress UspA family protein
LSTVVIAVDDSPAARPALEVGRAVAELTGAAARAVHVRERGSSGPRALADQLGIPLDVVEGPVTDRLLPSMAAADVLLGVVGARGAPGGARPVGSTTLALLEHSATPLVVVPPDARPPSGPIRRIVAPLEGSASSSEALGAGLPSLLSRPVDLVVVHVVEPGAPVVLDHPRWDLDMWRDEFVSRHCPAATRARVATGHVADAVREAARRETADLVVLTWGQDVAPDRAAVVRDVLGHSRLPVLLIPEQRS